MIAAAEQKTGLHEIAFCDFLAKRSNGAEADDVLTQALTACLSAGIEVVSVLPEWVELRVPCDLATICPLQELVTHLEPGSRPRSAKRSVTPSGRCFATLSSTAAISIRRHWLRSGWCASSAHLFVESKIRATAATLPAWTTQQSITQMTIPSATPPCGKRRVCAGEASAFCSPASSSTTWSTTSGIMKCCSLSTYLELKGRLRPRRQRSDERDYALEVESEVMRSRQSAYSQLDKRITDWMARHGITLLRVSLGVVPIRQADAYQQLTLSSNITCAD